MSTLKTKKKGNYFPMQYLTNPIFIGVVAFGQQMRNKKHKIRED